MSCGQYLIFINDFHTLTSMRVGRRAHAHQPIDSMKLQNINYIQHSMNLGQWPTLLCACCSSRLLAVGTCTTVKTIHLMFGGCETHYACTATNRPHINTL